MNNPISYQVQHLQRLSSLLNYEVSSAAIFALSFFYPTLLYISIVAAIIILPFMFYVLVKERKYGWIIFFLITIILPLSFLVESELDIKIGTYLIFGLFYFYCFILMYAVRSWIQERLSKIKLYHQNLNSK